MLNQTDDNFLYVKIHFPVGLSLLIAFSAAGIDVIYFLLTHSWEKTLVFFGATAAASGAILAAIYTARILAVTINQHKGVQHQLLQSRLLEKRLVALRFAERWNNPSMRSTRRVCRRIVNLKTAGQQEIEAAIMNGKSIDKIIHLLNFLEEISIAVFEDSASRRLAKMFFGDIVHQVWKSLENWILNYRIERGSNGMWAELQKLQAEWGAELE